MRNSTRIFRNTGRQVEGYGLVDFIHGYIYARWPYLYIGLAKGHRPIPVLLKPLVVLAAWILLRTAFGRSAQAKVAFAECYHGKVVPTESAERLVTLDHPIELHDLEHVIPYATARDILLSDPDHIAVLDCPCRVESDTPCLPLDVCLIVGEPFAQFILEHHPKRARRISQEEAVAILRAERDRGHVHHAFFKDAMLKRFYAICNCCSCCCGAMQAHRNGTPMLISSGYVAQLSRETCVGCGRCAAACPFGAISVSEGAAVVREADCMGCGVCVSACPHGALSLSLAPERGEPLDLTALLPEEN